MTTVTSTHVARWHRITRRLMVASGITGWSAYVAFLANPDNPTVAKCFLWAFIGTACLYLTADSIGWNVEQRYERQRMRHAVRGR